MKSEEDEPRGMRERREGLCKRRSLDIQGVSHEVMTVVQSLLL